MASEITKDYHDLDPLLICPLRGGVFFLNELVQYLKFPLELDFISIASAEGIYRIRKDIALNLKDRHILIVTGIIDTAQKIHFLKERIKIGHPASIKIASLLDKPSRRALPIHGDYIGRVVEDRFVVGCGMDADELGRNYRDISIFVQ